MESPSTRIASMYWGQYSYLYNTLSNSEVELLENAILARRLGRFGDAREIHDERLPPTRFVPVLALEKANLASRLGLPGEQYAILKESLNCSANWRQPGSHRDKALLKISMTEAKFQWTGAAKTALDEARFLRDQWTVPSWDTWTDVEIAYVAKYFTIMKNCRMYTNWVTLDGDAMFLATHSANPWSGLGSIIKIAKEQGNLSACLDLIDIYAEVLDKDQKLAIYSEFINECEANTVSKTRQSSLLLIYSRLWFATVLRDVSEDQRSSEQLDKVQGELSTLTWILETDTPNLMLKHLRMPSHEKLIVPSQTLNYFETASELLDMAIVANNCEDRLLETQLLARAMTSLNQVSQSQRYQEWYDLNERLAARFSDIHENSLTRAVLRAATVNRLGNTIGASQDQSKPREFLQELHRFQNSYPEFDIPVSLRDLFRGAAVSSRQLGDNDKAIYFEEKLKVTLSDCPVDHSQFYRIYRGKPFNEWAPHLIDIMIPWIKSDLVNARLSIDQVAFMLNISSLGLSSEAEVDLDSILKVLERPAEAFVGGIFGFSVPLSCEAWESRLQSFEEWLWSAPSHIDRYIRHTILGDIQQARCASVQNYVLQVTNRSSSLLGKDISKITKEDIAAVYDEDLQMDVRVMKSTENIRLVDLRKRLDHRAMGTDNESAFGDGWTLMCERLQLATSFKAFRNGFIRDQDLAEAQLWFEEAYPKLNSNNVTRRLATLQEISSCKSQRYVMFGTLAPDASLDTYEQYDREYTKQRVARSILRGAESVTARTAIIAQWSFTNHYDFAMGACVEAIGAGRRRKAYHCHIHQDLNYTVPSTPPPTRDQKLLFTNLIEWAQKKKARSITEALGAELIVSRNFLSDIDGQEDVLMLLEREAELQNKVNGAKEEVIELTRMLDQLRQDMRMCPALKKIMELRDGQALTESQIQSFASQLGEDVIIIDFVYLPTAFTALLGEYIPMVYKKGRLISAAFVTHELRQERIKKFLDEYFLDKDKPFSDNDPVLNFLFPLIEAGVKFSNPGDTIVLCPTDILKDIPLHAIELPNGVPWIQRNPIVYTQSLSVLRLCYYAALARKPGSRVKPLAIQALSDHDQKLPGAAKMRFATRCHARLLQGEALTNESLLARCAESELINFYGHVGFDPKRPLDQFLAIRQLDAQKVTVRELFDLRLLRGTHVNLIGCRSGRSNVGINDDQLGLSTALFFAGAASLVTTLWSIDMADGNTFQEAFFDELLTQNGELESTASKAAGKVAGDNFNHHLLDLAKALQAAILRISVDETGQRKAPYHWAAFRLHGYWKDFPSLEVDYDADDNFNDTNSSVTEAIAKLNVD